MIVAFAGIAPVEQEDAAVRPVAQVDPAEPGIGGEEDVRLVAADVAAAGRVRAARHSCDDRGSSGSGAGPDRIPAIGRPGRS